MTRKQAFIMLTTAMRKNHNFRGVCLERGTERWLSKRANDKTDRAYDPLTGVNWEVLWCRRKCPGSAIRGGKLYFLLTARQLWDFIEEMNRLNWPA